MKFGLNVVTKPTDDFFDKNLFVKPVACAGEMLRAITNYSKKGNWNLQLVLPSILSEYSRIYCFFCFRCISSNSGPIYFCVASFC